MNSAEPAQYFSSRGYFGVANTATYSTEQLEALKLELHALQDYASDLHHLACQAQELSKPEDCDGDGLCNESIRRVKPLKEVLQFSASKGTLLDDSVGAYQWNPKYKDDPAEAFDKIKARFLFPLPTLAE